jgi:hypothetical protein
VAVWVVKGVLRVAQYVAPGWQRATTGDREAKGRVGLKGARSYYERPEGFWRILPAGIPQGR